MNYHTLADKMKQAYDPIAERYRLDDERDAMGNDHRRICSTLSRISSSFARPITVLDVGCGTGRYFHCLKNVQTLTGIDVSEAMLQQARCPVKATEITIQEINLFSANIYTATFSPESFDLIYAIGVFGNGCAPTIELCNKFYDWLAPQGVLFFDLFDTSGLPVLTKCRKHIRNFIYSMVPCALQEAWDKRTGWLPFHMATQAGVSKLFTKTRFKEFSVKSTPSQLTLGAGAKLECIAVKENRTVDLNKYSLVAA